MLRITRRMLESRNNYKEKNESSISNVITNIIWGILWSPTKTRSNCSTRWILSINSIDIGEGCWIFFRRSFCHCRSILYSLFHFWTWILVTIFIGCPIILPRESESVLLGAAILGAVASKKFSNLREAMKAMNAAGQVCLPFFLSQTLMYFYFCIHMRN